MLQKIKLSRKKLISWVTCSGIGIIIGLLTYLLVKGKIPIEGVLVGVLLGLGIYGFLTSLREIIKRKKEAKA